MEVPWQLVAPWFAGPMCSGAAGAQGGTALVPPPLRLWVLWFLYSWVGARLLVENPVLKR